MEKSEKKVDYSGAVKVPVLIVQTESFALNLTEQQDVVTRQRKTKQRNLEATHSLDLSLRKKKCTLLLNKTIIIITVVFSSFFL